MRSLKPAAVHVMFLALLAVFSYHLPFSLLFSRLHSYNDLFKLVEVTNSKRASRERNYFSGLDAKTSKNFYEGRLQDGDLSIAIGIISTKRKESRDSANSLGYLYPSAAALDRMVKRQQLHNGSIVFICNVDLYPETHQDARHIAQFMPHIERFGENSMGIQHSLTLPNSSQAFKNIRKHRSVYVKESYDYVFCLNAASALKPKFVLLVEEDTIPLNSFPLVFNHLFNQHLNREYFHGQGFGFIKFYFPAKWQGFSFQVIEILDLVSISILGSACYCLLSHVFAKRKWLGDGSTTYVRTDFLKGFLLSVLSCYIIGRQNINELRRLSPAFYRYRTSETCCTQAMLYPASLVHRLSVFMLGSVNTAATDLLIGDFVFTENLRSYQVEPSVFHHTGIHSTLLNKQKHPEEFLIQD